MYIMSMREVVEYYYKLLAENKKQKEAAGKQSAALATDFVFAARGDKRQLMAPGAKVSYKVE